MKFGNTYTGLGLAFACTLMATAAHADIIAGSWTGLATQLWTNQVPNEGQFGNAALGCSSDNNYCTGDVFSGTYTFDSTGATSFQQSPFNNYGNFGPGTWSFSITNVTLGLTFSESASGVQDYNGVPPYAPCSGNTPACETQDLTLAGPDGYFGMTVGDGSYIIQQNNYPSGYLDYGHFLTNYASLNNSFSLAGTAEAPVGSGQLSGFNFDILSVVQDDTSVAPVPEPGSLMLIGAGLAGLGFLRRRKHA